ncbi:MAG: hypothetical protein AAFX99_11745, partial [Myxococcota bacterium]
LLRVSHPVEYENRDLGWPCNSGLRSRPSVPEGSCPLLHCWSAPPPSSPGPPHLSHSFCAPQTLSVQPDESDFEKKV